MTDQPIELARLSPPEKRQLLERLLKQKAEFDQLSYSQRGMWLLYQLAPQSAAYNTGFAMRVLAELDLAAFERSIKVLAARHATLRTTFAVRDGQPIQCLHPGTDLFLKQVDATGWDEATLRGQVQEAADQPFDLENGPLARFTLFTRNARDHVLLIIIHHIVFDGWSFWILLDELMVLYEAECRGLPHALPSLRANYTHFVHSEKKMLSGPEGEAHRAFWERQLAGELPLLELPADRPRPAHQVFEGKTLVFEVEADLAVRLKELAGTEGCTLFTILLAAFQVFLFRYTGQEDILVGSPTTGRSQPEFAGIIGDFVNMVVLRCRPLGRLTFREFLKQTRRTVLEALDHQEYPFTLLVEQLGVSRNAGYSPLCQTAFLFHKAQRAGHFLALLDSDAGDVRVNWGGLMLAPFPISLQNGQFDLTLEIADKGERLIGGFKYNTALFETATAGRMLEHFQTLLKGIASDPSRRLSDLPLLTSKEHRRITEEWNQTNVSLPEPHQIHCLIESQAKRTPEALAIMAGSRKLTYLNLNQQANRVAHYLRRHGIGPKSLVALCVDRTPNMVAGLLGILKAGGAYVPLDPEMLAARRVSMLRDSAAEVLLTEERLLATLPEYNGRIVCLDRDWEDISKESMENPRNLTDSEDPAYVIYTSGSTGNPKGVEIPHRAVVNLLQAMSRSPGMSAKDVLVAVTTLSFDIAGLEIYLPLSVGAKVVIADSTTVSDGAALAALLTQSHATVMQATPATWKLLLASGWKNMTGMRMLCGGEELPTELAKALLEGGGELWNLYGPTETTIWSTLERVRGNEKLVPIGRPISNTRIYVLDRHLQPVPVGVPGELYIGGDGLARGYWRQPELTAEKFISDPFNSQPGERLYKTGDLARWKLDGRIECIGRIDRQVKLRGFRIELGEIETALRRHASIKDAVVIARSVEAGEKVLAAYILPASEPPDFANVRAFLQQTLPAYMIPSRFVSLDRFPLTPNGKVDVKALPTFGNASEMSHGYASPQTPIEEIVAGIWASVLGTGKVGIHDNFFDLGGHSLLASRLLARLQSAFQTDLPLRSIFLEPTISGWAKLIRYDEATQSYCYVGHTQQWKRMIVAQPRGNRVPLFLVAGHEGPDDTLLVLSRIIPHLERNQPVYGFRPRWLEGGPGYSSVEEAAGEFLTELRTVQPCGPYLLGGYCIGGIVALEMARQLQSEGEEVALLALIDTQRSTPMRALLANGELAWQRTKHIVTVLLDIVRADGRSRSGMVVNLMRRKFGTRSTHTAEDVDHNTFYHSKVDYRRMVYKHKVKPYRGQITAFVNERQHWIDRTMGWKGIPQAGLVVHRVQGDHLTMLTEYAKRFSQLLGLCIDEALAEQRRAKHSKAATS